MSLLQTLTHLHPDAALLLLTAGVLLIYVELNRPGRVLPGTFGLLIALLSTASLLHNDLSPASVLLVATGIALLTLNLLRPTHPLVLVAAALALTLGFAFLVRGPGGAHIRPATAAISGLVLGAGTSLLTGIARRARTSKRGKLT